MQFNLNIACGTHLIDGWINMDLTLPCNLIADINFLPFKTASLDTILVAHILEHIHNLVSVQRELARILKEGCELKIIVPAYDSVDAWGDPTHCRAFSEMSFIPEYWPGFDLMSLERITMKKGFRNIKTEILEITMKRNKSNPYEYNIFHKSGLGRGLSLGEDFSS